MRGSRAGSRGRRPGKGRLAAQRGHAHSRYGTRRFGFLLKKFATSCIVAGVRRDFSTPETPKNKKLSARFSDKRRRNANTA